MYDNKNNQDDELTSNFASHNIWKSSPVSWHVIWVLLSKKSFLGKTSDFPDSLKSFCNNKTINTKIKVLIESKISFWD